MAAAKVDSVTVERLDGRLQWQLLSDDGPHLTRHAACLLGGKLYVHGGQASMTPTAAVQFQLYRFHLDTSSWEVLSCDAAPALSAHVMLSYGHDHLIIIGGWTGKRRAFEVTLLSRLLVCCMLT